MKKHIINERHLDIVYDEVLNETADVYDKRIIKYRTKIIRSGEFVECEVYPVWNTANATRKARKNITRDAVKNVNKRNSIKKVIRLLNTNFTTQDAWFTLTYDEENLPTDEIQAKKNIVNYLRRLKKLVATNNYQDLKFIYVTEHKRKRIHHHLIMNYPNHKEAESLWKGGTRNHSRKLKLSENGFEALARYITKEEKENNKQNYSCSRNLEKPEINVSDYKITKGQARKLAKGKITPHELFKKYLPNYLLNDIEIKTSEWIDGTYIYAKFKRLRI